VFDKFFAGWNADCTDYASERGTKEEPKPAWVKRIAAAGSDATRKALQGEALQEAVERQRALVDALGGTTWLAVATSRFVTGTGIANPLENGFAFHHALGAPYLAATGLKGALRACWEQWHPEAVEDETIATRLFGRPGAGGVVFFDMLPMKPPTLAPEVMTPHYGAWYGAREAEVAEKAPGDWMSPTPIPFLAVEAGAVFQIGAAPRTAGDRRWPENRARIETILRGADGRPGAMDIGLGAKTAVGHGRFRLFAAGEQRQAEELAAEIELSLKRQWQPAAPAGGPRSGPRPQQGGRSFAAGQKLAAGTRLSWREIGNVVLVREVTLRPGIKLPVRFVDDGQEDDAPIGDIKELRHIK
jgi:CRISPR-associated protein Cmr6